MARNQAPITCISVLVCDDAFRDMTTKKVALWGIFNEINTQSVPCVVRLCIAATLTNGRGKRNVCVSIERASDNEPVVEISGPMEFKSPLDIVDMHIKIIGVKFNRFGKHWVSVKEDERVLSQRPFFVQKLGKKRRKDSGEADDGTNES
jgi:hypothetical protein